MMGEGKRDSLPNTPQEAQMQAYCFKCKQKRELKNPKEVTLKNGRKAVKGTCPVCGGNISRMGGMK
jgi:hypothetical protein